MIGGVQLVPAIAFGSGNVVSVWLEAGPWTSAMRYHPGWGTVAVTDTDTVCPGWNALTIPVGVTGVVAGSSVVLRVAAQGPFFCGEPWVLCDIHDMGVFSLK